MGPAISKCTSFHYWQEWLCEKDNEQVGPFQVLGVILPDYVSGIDLEVSVLFTHQTQASHSHSPSSPFLGSPHSPAPLTASWILTQEHSLNSAPLFLNFCAYSFLPDSAKLPYLSGFSLPFSECLDTQEVSIFLNLYFPESSTHRTK